MWACDNEFTISTDTLSTIIDIFESLIQIIMLVGVNMSVLNVVAVIGCMGVKRAAEIVIVI